MGKISNTSKYPTVTPASADYMVATDVSDENNTKTVTVGSMATPMLGALSSATPAIDDKLVGLDTSDSDNAKKFVVSDVLKTPVSATAAIDDKLIGLDTNDSDTPKRVTVSDVLKTPASATAAIDDKLIGLDTSDSDTPKRLTVSDVLKSPVSATAAIDDKLIGLDTNDSDTPKQLTVSDVLKTPPLVTADVASDHFLLLDASDSSNPKKALITDITSLSGYVEELFSKNDASQTLAGTGTKTSVVFGAGTIGTNVSINGTNGTVTFNTVGDYFVQAHFSVGNVGGTASVMFMNYEINGTVSNISPTMNSFPASVVVRSNVISFPIKVTSASTTLKFSFAVKAGGNAGLLANSTSISGMTDVPSASISVYKKQ